MLRDYRLYLDDIQAAIEKINRYTNQISDVEAFAANEVTVEAVLYNLFAFALRRRSCTTQAAKRA